VKAVTHGFDVMTFCISDHSLHLRYVEHTRATAMGAASGLYIDVNFTEHHGS
jgi:hypothetical protein